MANENLWSHGLHTIPSPDNGPEIRFYTLERPDTVNAGIPWHIIVQGSSFDSVAPTLYMTQKKAKHTLALELVAADAPVVLIEKPGITEHACDKAILHTYNTIDQRIQDLCAVFTHLKTGTPQRSCILIGVSEGAEIVTRAAAHTPELRALVLIAWVSEQSSEELAISFLLQEHFRPMLWPLMRPCIRWYVRTAARKIATHPHATDRFFLDNSYRYWTSFMQRDPRQILQYTNIPLCVIHGADDLIVAHSESLMRELQLTSTASVAWLRYAHTAHRFNMSLVAGDTIRWLRKIGSLPPLG